MSGRVTRRNTGLNTGRGLAALGASLLLLMLAFALVASPITAWAAGRIPDQRQLPLVVDRADLLSDSEEQRLIELFERLGSEQGIEIAVVTVNSLEGKSAMDYADDFYDYNGYGVGPRKDGILLLVSMADRDWWITTTGRAMDQLTEDRFNDMTSSVVPYLSSGDYYQAFANFGYKSAELMTLPDPDYREPVTIWQVVQQVLVWLGIGAGGGGLSAFGSTQVMKSRHKSVISKRDARNYLRAVQEGKQKPAPYLNKGGLNFSNRTNIFGNSLIEVSKSLALRASNDVFLSQNTTRHRRNTDTGSRGGGRSIGGGGGGFGGHVGSSGSGHGGGGGKF